MESYYIGTHVLDIDIMAVWQINAYIMKWQIIYYEFQLCFANRSVSGKGAEVEVEFEVGSEIFLQY